MDDIFVFAMKRSGHHAIIKWIGAHLPYEALRINNLRGPRIADRIGLERAHRELGGLPVEAPNYRWATPDDIELLRSDSRPTVVVNWESVPLATMNWQDYGVPLTRACRRLYVVRDVFNMLASAMGWSAQSDPTALAGQWLSDLKVVLSRPAQFLLVNYNAWCYKDNYRRMLARRLGLTGYSRPSELCAPGVSSFADGADPAGTQPFSERWRRYVEEPWFRELGDKPAVTGMVQQLFPFDDAVMEAVEKVKSPATSRK